MSTLKVSSYTDQETGSPSRHTSDIVTAPSILPSSPNPWSDPTPPASADPTTEKARPTPLTTLDQSVYEKAVFAGPPRTPSDAGTEPQSAAADAAAAAMREREVLAEFDPLASYEEAAAREAWAASEGHPPQPPPRTPSESPPDSPSTEPPSPKTPPPKDTQKPPVPAKDLYLSSPMSPPGPNPADGINAPTPVALVSPPAAGPSGSSAATSSSPFPSFAALARSFALPLARPRPQSIDAVAKTVPSPATLSSFAQQQQQQPPGQGQGQDAGKAPASMASGRQGSSGSGSPVPRAAPADGGFDFQKFLDQMKTKSAEPVSKYLRSFLSNFAKRTFTVNDQVKIINDYLAFIAGQMRECDVWRNCSDADFENAMEGMEKLVMNRLYDFTFTPQLALASPPRPITTDDLERDRVLAQRIALFGWLEEKHLDIPEGEGSKGFLMFAEQELLKINHYKAPRDKLICILNCCKVIFGLIRHLHKEEGADSFVPILIFVVLKANPEHLLSNVEFINRFRNPEKLQSEAGYYLSSLMGAVSFIESMDHTSLSNITQEEFEKNVEEAIQALPPSEPQSPNIAFTEAKLRGIINTSTSMPTPQSPRAGEESAQPLALATPSHARTPAPLSLGDDARRLLQRTGDTFSKPLSAIGRIFSEALDGAEGKLANLGAEGKMSYLPGPFAPFELGREGRAEKEAAAQVHANANAHGYVVGAGGAGGAMATPHSAGSSTGPWDVPQTPYGPAGAPPVIQTPYKPRVRRAGGGGSGFASPGVSPGWGPEETPSRAGPYTNQPLAMGPSQPASASALGYGTYPYLAPPRVQALSGGYDSDGSGSGSHSAHISRTPTPALDLAGVQAQIDSAHAQAASEARETLRQIFPVVDREIVEWVLEANDGDLGKSIEQLLDISGD